MKQKVEETTTVEEQEETVDNKDLLEIEQLKSDIQQLKDYSLEIEGKLTYSQAELINYRKRKDEEVRNLLVYANKDIILELIPIIDNFERAMKVADQNDETTKFLEGIQMIYQHFVDTLHKFGVTEIEALGLVFDPTCHEAMLTDCDKEKEDDIVLEVLMKGYRLKDRVLRPAVVKINKLED